MNEDSNKKTGILSYQKRPKNKESVNFKSDSNRSDTFKMGRGWKEYPEFDKRYCFHLKFSKEMKIIVEQRP